MRGSISVALLALGLSVTGCGAPPEVVSAPSAPAAPRPVASASASGTAAPAAEAPEEPLLDPAAPLPPGAVARLGTTRMRLRSSWPTPAAFTAGGTPIVLEEGDGLEVRDLWRDKTLTPPGFGRGASYQATDATFAPDGSFFVTTRSVKKVLEVSLHGLGATVGTRWTVEVTAPTVKSRASSQKSVQQFAELWDVMPSPDGAHVAVMFATGDVTVLAAADGAVTGRIPGGKGLLTALSRGGKLALIVDDAAGAGTGRFASMADLGLTGESGPRVRVVQVIDTKTGAVLRKLEPKVPARLALTPDGNEIVALWERALVAVNVATGARRVVAENALPVGASAIWTSSEPTLRMAPDGSRVAISAGKTDVRRLSDGVAIETGLSGSPRCFSADGSLLLMAERNVARVVGRDDAVPEGHEAPVSRLAFTAGGRSLVSSAEDVRFWNPRSGRRRAIAPSAKATVLASDPAGEHLVLGGAGLRAVTADGSMVSIAPIESSPGSGKELNVVEAAPLPGGAAVAVLTKATYLSPEPLRLWSMAGVKEIAKAKVGSPTRIAAGPEGRRIAVLGGDTGAEVTVLDAKSLTVERRLPTSVGPGGWLAFAGDDGALLVGGDAVGMTLLDLERGEPRKKFGGACCTVGAASRDGRLVAGATGNSVMLWQVEPQRLLSVFQGHKGSVEALAFSPDGALLASASRDTSILVWDTTAAVQPTATAFAATLPGVISTRAARDEAGR